jgi:transposase
VGKKTGPNPTDRGKLGVKRSILTEARGIPIAVAIAGANVHDSKLLERTLEQVRVLRPDPLLVEQHFLADKGYDSEECRSTSAEYGYREHISQKKNAKTKRVRTRGRRKSRRWVVERTNSWVNRFRRILIRWEKKAVNYAGMLALACATQILQKIHVCG